MERGREAGACVSRQRCRTADAACTEELLRAPPEVRPTATTATVTPRGKPSKSAGLFAPSFGKRGNWPTPLADQDRECCREARSGLEAAGPGGAGQGARGVSYRLITNGGRTSRPTFARLTADQRAFVGRLEYRLPLSRRREISSSRDLASYLSSHLLLPPVRALDRSYTVEAITTLARASGHLTPRSRGSAYA